MEYPDNGEEGGFAVMLRLWPSSWTFPTQPRAGECSCAKRHQEALNDWDNDLGAGMGKRSGRAT